MGLGFELRQGMGLHLEQKLPLGNVCLNNLSLLEMEVLLEQSRESIEDFYQKTPEHKATGNYLFHPSFQRNTQAVKGKVSLKEHLKYPQIIVHKYGDDNRENNSAAYAVSYNSELEKRVLDKLKFFHRPEGSEQVPLENNFTRQFIRQLNWIKEQQQKIVGYLLQRQEKYLASGNPFDLEPVRQWEIAEEIGFHDSTISKLMRNLTVQLPEGKTIFAEELAPSYRTTRLQGVYALTELMKEPQYFTEGKWTISAEKLRPVLLERFGLDLARRTVAKYQERISSERGEENA